MNRGCGAEHIIVVGVRIGGKGVIGKTHEVVSAGSGHYFIYKQDKFHCFSHFALGLGIILVS